MGCCCCKKKVEPKQKQIDYEGLKKKYGKVVVNYIVQENIEDLKKVLEDGFPPDMPFDIGGQDSTLTILSIVYKKYDITKLLLEYEQDLNIQIPPNMDFALLSAISSGSSEIVNLLVEKGADKTLTTKSGKTLYSIASATLEQKEQRGDTEASKIYNQIVQALR